MKYYVVKVGRNPGIYTSWEDCKKEVEKYSGAVYKSFSDYNSAVLFLGTSSFQENKSLLIEESKSVIGEEQQKEQVEKVDITPKENKEKQENKEIILEIYTDGSHYKHAETEINTKIGLGGFLILNRKEYCWSSPVDSIILKRYNINEKISNCTAEFLAVVEVLRLIVDNIDKNVKVIFYNDYIGVEKWISGEWKCKKPYIKNIQMEYFKLVSCRKNIKVEFKHVDGHSGVYGNEMADTLAKSLQYRDDLSILFKNL